MKKQGAERALQAKYRDYVSEGSAATISKKPTSGKQTKIQVQPGVAQLVARLTGGQEAVSSSLATRTS